jgi:AraC-like DNA-binding protein
MENTLSIIVNFTAIINLLIMSLFLLFRKKNSRANTILSIIFFIPIFNYLFNFFLLQDIHKGIFTLYVISNISFILPLLSCVYTNTFIGRPFKFLKLYHIPFYISVISLSYILITFHQSNYLDFFKGIKNNKPSILFNWLNFIFLFNNIYYAVLNLRRIKKTKPFLDMNIDFHKITFIVNFNYALLGLTLFSVLSYIVFPPKIAEFLVMPLIMIIVFFFIIFSAINNYALFSKREMALFLNQNQSLVNALEQNNTKINPQKINEIVKKIDLEMSNKIFLNANLSLAEFSKKLEIKPYVLTQVFKQYYQTTFYDFINTKRVKHSIELLKNINHNNMTIEGVGLSSGFNSRVSYYRNFKKIIGVTPKGFLTTANL